MKTYKSPDGLDLAYTDSGEGLPVLCLSGLTRDSRDFDYVARHLPGVRLIRADYRGRGASAWADPASYKVPVEAGDAFALMELLGLDRVAILGTSRGGLVGMAMAAMAKPRIIGLCMNDVGPVVERGELEKIKGYVGFRPRFAKREAMAEAMPAAMPGFANVPASRWLEEVERHTSLTPDGLGLTYDPRLRESFLEDYDRAVADLWPLFDALAGLPVAVIRGANSNLLSAATVAEMARRHPGLIAAEVPDRGHVPFLDEPEALEAIRAWLELMR